MNRTFFAAAAAAALTAGAIAPAHAGGMQLSTRGVRPSARAGAFVAGADDLGALWFNPAGLAEMAGGEKKTEFLVDFGYVAQSVDYTRIDTGMNTQATVSNSAPGLPIPTIALGFDWGKRMTLTFGVLAPYAGLGKYPSDGAQRYSVIDLSESLLVVLQATVAYRVSENLRVGFGVQNMVFHLASSLVFGGCPGQTVCAPEDPEFDATTKVTQTDYLSPSIVGGIQYDLGKKARVGFSVQGPFYIDSEGKFEASLPDSGLYNGASVVGDRADVTFTLPWMFRAGIELRPNDKLRIELAGDYELWSMQDEFRIAPDNVHIDNIAGIGTYTLLPLVLPRKYDDTMSVALGLEGTLPIPALPVKLRAGYAYETAAAPDAYLSVLTVDGAKHVLGLGGGAEIGKWKVDAMLGYVAVETRTVDPEVGRSPQLTPVREGDDALPVYVNWGTYESHWIMGGLALSSSF